MIEFNWGWNNVNPKSKRVLLIKSLMNGEDITNEDDLLELEMLGLINPIKRTWKKGG